jgi:hypothetical protein
MGWVGSLQLFILAGGMLPMLAGCPKAGVHDDLLGDGLSCQWPKDAMAQAVSEKGAVCDFTYAALRHDSQFHRRGFASSSCDGVSTKPSESSVGWSAGEG